MLHSTYVVERIDWAHVKVTVWPVPATGWASVALVMMVVIVSVMVAFVSTVEPSATVVIGAVICFRLTLKWASDNRGRRISQFVVTPLAIVRFRHDTPVKSIALGDIARIYLTAPGARQIAIYPRFVPTARPAASGRPEVARSSACRSWRLIVEANGVEHCLAGGMTEPTALAVARAICNRPPM